MQETVPPSPPHAEPAAMQQDQSRDDGATVQRQQRHRQRPRRRQRAGQDRSGSPALAERRSKVISEASPISLASSVNNPPCIIDWTERVSQAEDLGRALVITVIADGPLPPVEEVQTVIATRLDVEATSLVLRQASPASYLLFLPSDQLVDCLLGLRQPLRSPRFHLLCKRWSRLTGATRRVIP